MRPAEDDPSALTLQEYAALFRLPVATARHQLLALIDAGKAVRTRKRMTNHYGRTIAYQAFKLKGRR